MIDQYFGHKELYEVVFRARAPMQLGNRYIEAQEPVLYFENVKLSFLSEDSYPILARGGWGNMPQVIWNDRKEVEFQLIEGIISSTGMGILLGSNILTSQKDEPLYIHIKEGPLQPNVKIDEVTNQEYTYVDLKYNPVDASIRKTFIFECYGDVIQNKIYGKRIKGVVNPFGNIVNRIALYEDKNCTIPAKSSQEYVVDYYYKYGDEVIIYSIGQERLNELFTLEAKFYSKDENEGHNYTNILYMPKVKIVNNINLQLGERANPTVSTFNIIGMPETVGDQKNLIVKITRLDEEIDADI